MATLEAVAAAFTEWERQYREDPEKFLTTQERIAMEVDDLGMRRALYLFELLDTGSAL